MNSTHFPPETSDPARLDRTKHDVPQIGRINDPEIVPFEVWDLVVNDRIWAEQFYETGFPAALRNGIECLRRGEGMTRSNGPVPFVVGGFEAVFLAGGRAGPKAPRELTGIPTAVVIGNDGAFAAMAGGLHWLQINGYSGWVLDLGQSQLKLATSNRRWSFQRDSTRLRAAGEVGADGLPTQQRRLREFIGLKLQLALLETRHRPHALVAALPTRISNDGTPIGGNYAGLRGYRDLIPDALELAGLKDVPVFVLNDAELAAHSARLDPRLTSYRKVLVLTLGFGIGAALIQRVD